VRIPSTAQRSIGQTQQTYVAVYKLLLMVLSVLLCQSAFAATRVYLATMEAGPQFFERFGHNAIVVHQADSAVAYNFGYFDFAGENFLRNFVRGKMMYLGVALDAQADIQSYIQRGRTVWMQELNLSAAQTQTLIEKLTRETTAPNDVYRYDYFRSNCSTKIRDALNDALGGQIAAGLAGRSHGQTYRSLGISHAAQPLWLYLGIHAGLGPSADQPLDIYAESFIPAALQQAVAQITVRDQAGVLIPLVANTQVFSHNNGLTNDSPTKVNSAQLPPIPNWRWRFLMCGLCVAIVIALGFRFPEQYVLRRFSALVASISALILGAGGVLLAFLWIATDHQDAYRNLNLSLFNPLWLVCVPALLMSAFEKPVAISSWTRTAAHIACGLALLGVAAKTFPGVRQQSIEWVLLIVPILVSLQFALRSAAARTRTLASDRASA
jgi:hypothetical protein